MGEISRQKLLTYGIGRNNLIVSVRLMTYHVRSDPIMNEHLTYLLPALLFQASPFYLWYLVLLISSSFPPNKLQIAKECTYSQRRRLIT